MSTSQSEQVRVAYGLMEQALAILDTGHPVAAAKLADIMGLLNVDTTDYAAALDGQDNLN